MARLCTAVIMASCLVLIWASRSPIFNAGLSSPTLVHSLAADYLAVDAVYGGATNPYTIDAVLHRQDPPPPSMGFVSHTPPFTIANATDGVRYAQQAEGAVAALGATAELAPVRSELLQSYRDVEAAWRSEHRVEQAITSVRPSVVGNRFGDTPTVLAATTRSIASIQQARSLHDQAIAAVKVLGGGSPSSTTTDRSIRSRRYLPYGDPHRP